MQEMFKFQRSLPFTTTQTGGGTEGDRRAARLAQRSAGTEGDRRAAQWQALPGSGRSAEGALPRRSTCHCLRSRLARDGEDIKQPRSCWRWSTTSRSSPCKSTSTGSTT